MARMDFRAVITTAIVLCCCAAPARAQQAVKLEFQGGLVTLRAQNAPIRAILAEWAKLGGATIVNGDRVAGPPVTLELNAVPERQALDTLLRSVAGYMLAPRRAGSTGVSAFDRILILPTSAAPRNPPPTTSVSAPPRIVLPRPPIVRQPAGDPSDGAVEDVADQDNPDDAADDAPTPNQVPGAPRVVVPPRPIQPPPPFGTEPQVVVPGDDNADASTATPGKGVAPTPANPFGVPFGSSAMPGVVTPVPQQPQTQTAPAPRPQQR